MYSLLYVLISLTTFLLPSSTIPLFGLLIMLTTGDQEQKAIPRAGVEPTPLLSVTFAPAGHVSDDGAYPFSGRRGIAVPLPLDYLG
jgi:hypothetical protein